MLCFRMTRTVYNIDLNQIAWVRATLDCKSNEALRLLQLYGYLEHVSSGGNAITFKQSVYAEKTGFTRDTVQRDLATLAKQGWAEVHGQIRGTEVSVIGIPFDVDLVDMSSPSTCRATRQPSVDLLDSELPTESTTLKKVFKNSSYEEEEGPTTSKPNLKSELVSVWNEHRPKAWPALKSISPSRDRSIRALGGYRAVIDLLPDALRGAGASKFWRDKAITWENLIGSGTTPKGHLHSLAETAPASTGKNSNTPPQAVEHPDFFPPVDAFSELRAKHNNFADDDENAFDRGEVDRVRIA